MPVEIRELVIRAIVTQEGSEEKKGDGGGGVDTEAIVETCVEQVLEILKRERER